MRVLITGATGFIGTAIVAALRARGDRVIALSRDVERARRGLGAGVEVHAAELESPGAWQAQVQGVDAVVHLAGETIGQRWDGRIKQRIRDSRVESTRRLVEAIAAAPAAARPTVLVSASGADYYPFATDVTEFDDDDVAESDPPGDSFLARLCRDWEAEAVLAEPHGVRVVRMRTGLVLDRGGALARMAGPFRFFGGGRLGSGRQWVSWIHRTDVVGAYLAALDDDAWSGPVNLVAPEAVRAAELAAAIGRALHRPSWLPAPAFALRLVAGEMAAYLLAGRKVVPRALERFGYTFRFPRLDDALVASLG